MLSRDPIWIHLLVHSSLGTRNSLFFLIFIIYITSKFLVFKLIYFDSFEPNVLVGPLLVFNPLNASKNVKKKKYHILRRSEVGKAVK